MAASTQGETSRQRCEIGEWVEVQGVLLEPADRSPNLPPETAEKPLLVWVKGFAQAAASIGDELTVETMTGRLVTGTLSDVNPGYFQTFGRPPAGIVGIGRDLRAKLAEYHASEAASGGDAL